MTALVLSWIGVVLFTVGLWDVPPPGPDEIAHQLKSTVLMVSGVGVFFLSIGVAVTKDD